MKLVEMDIRLSIPVLLMLMLHAVSCKDSHFQGPNVALGKPATQSPGTYKNYTADLAVDGNNDIVLNKTGEHMCSHTDTLRDNNEASWTVDLGQSFVIKGIRIYKRVSFNGRRRGFRVYGDPGIDGRRPVLLYSGTTSHANGHSETIINITVAIKTPFRRITVEIPPRPAKKSYVILCEVEVYAMLCEFPTAGPTVQVQVVPDTGAMIETRYVTPGTQLWFPCQEGAKMIPQGSAILSCQDNGQYDTQYPNCVSEKLAPCPSPPALPHVRYLKVKSEYKPGYTVSWICEAGFSPQVIQQLTCTYASTWSVKLPNCLHVTCPHPGQLSDGNLINTQGQQYTSGPVDVGTVMNVSCNIGYKPSVEVIQCTQTSSDARWDGIANCTLIICQPLDDGEPYGVKYFYSPTDTRSQGYVFGSEAIAICFSDFKNIGEENTRTCEESGDWSGTPYVCGMTLCIAVILVQ